jgi:hypothetical protein
VRGADLSQLGKDGGFEGRDLRDGLDDKVDVGKILQLGAGGQALPGCGGILFGDSALPNILFEKLVGELETFVDGGLRGVDDYDGNGGSLRCYESDSKALSTSVVLQTTK